MNRGPNNVGELVAGRYEVKGFVGEGGMQHVYKAYDLTLDRYVALKTPKVSSAEKRFHRSAIVSSKVNHPNVAKTLDYFVTEDRPYLVEELIIGFDLAKAILKESNYLDPFLASKLFHHLAKGLAASHHANVMHRDLKPTNIMISRDFQLRAIKITDFGIAKMADEEIAEAVEGGDDTITSSQTMVGALPYMAPEAINTPREVTLKVDIWSLGAMMYEVITGSKPFGSGLRAVTAIVNEAIPDYPSHLFHNTQFSEHNKPLIEIINSCLEKLPENRPTADDLVKMCGKLCYPVSERKIGHVLSYQNNSFGYIASPESQRKVFFHVNNVYGTLPKAGQKVTYSEYSGSPYNRAYPVLLLEPAL